MTSTYLVFSQVPTLDLSRLAALAGTHFDARIESTRGLEGLTVIACGHSQSFALRVRETTVADLDRARQAERQGRAAGMATLAARCSTVVEVASEERPAEAAPREGPEVGFLRFGLLGALASLVLGPVLPPDDSTLFGTRGARERMLGARNLLAREGSVDTEAQLSHDTALAKR